MESATNTFITKHFVVLKICHFKVINFHPGLPPGDNHFKNVAELASENDFTSNNHFYFRFYENGSKMETEFRLIYNRYVIIMIVS